MNYESWVIYEEFVDRVPEDVVADGVDAISDYVEQEVARDLAYARLPDYLFNILDDFVDRVKWSGVAEAIYHRRA